MTSDYTISLQIKGVKIESTKTMTYIRTTTSYILPVRLYVCVSMFVTRQPLPCGPGLDFIS